MRFVLNDHDVNVVSVSDFAPNKSNKSALSPNKHALQIIFVRKLSCYCYFKSSDFVPNDSNKCTMTPNKYALLIMKIIG